MSQNEQINNQDNNKEKKNSSKLNDNENNKDKKYNSEILNVPSEYSNYDINFKVIVIGNSGVGKTCITNQAVKNIFTDKYQATIGMEIFTLFIKLDDKIVKLQIWDTCGQEIYRSLITNFYRSSSLAIIVYSIDQKESFKDLDVWIKELKANNSPDTKLMLVGNKLDLADKREVSYEEGKEYADDYGFIDFFETSAKTGENIKNMFIKAATILYEEHIKYKDVESNTSLSSFNPTYGQLLRRNKDKKDKKDKKNRCC